MEILVNIDVENLDKAIEFYTSAIGLRLSRRLFDDTAAELSGARTRIYLIENAPDSKAAMDSAIRRRFERHWTPVHLDFVVDDIDAATHRAVSAGARQETPIKDFPWGRLATFCDPFGNGFCLAWFPGAPYEDEHAG